MTDEHTLLALLKRAEEIDPILEVGFDTQLSVEQNPYGATKAIEKALYLIRDLIAALASATQSEPAGAPPAAPYAALSQHLNGDGEAPQTTPTCDMPDCTGPCQVLLMEPAMRCICRRCWRMMGCNA